MSKNIEMNYKNSDGSYEILYPRSTPEQVSSLALTGGTLTGPLMLSRQPQEEMEAVNLGYLNDQLGDKMNLQLFKEFQVNLNNTFARNQDQILQPAIDIAGIGGFGVLNIRGTLNYSFNSGPINAIYWYWGSNDSGQYLNQGLVQIMVPGGTSSYSSSIDLNHFFLFYRNRSVYGAAGRPNNYTNYKSYSMLWTSNDSGFIEVPNYILEQFRSTIVMKSSNTDTRCTVNLQSTWSFYNLIS